jgi:hypothetical protein
MDSLGNFSSRMANSSQCFEARQGRWKNHLTEGLNKPYLDPGEAPDLAKSENPWYMPAL